MGNQPSTFIATYNAWRQYRNTLPTPTNTSQTPQNKSNQANTNLGTSSTVAAQDRNRTSINSTKETVPVTPVNTQQIRNSIPSVITGSKIAPFSQQSQQNQFKRSSIADSIPQLPKTEGPTKQPLSSPVIPGAQPTILLSERGSSKDKKIKFPSKIDTIDTFKADVKAARQRIDTLANFQEKQYTWILSQIQNQKMNFIPDRNKLVYLLKEAKDYEKLIVGLRTKRQTVVRVLNDLNDQKYNEQMKGVIVEANQYIDMVQQQFIRIDWRAIILEAPTNFQRYIDVINSAVIDPSVIQSFAQIQGEVEAMRPPPPPPQPQVSIPTPEPTNILPQNTPKPIQQQQKQQVPATHRNSQQILVDSIEKIIIGEHQSPFQSDSLQVPKKESGIRRTSATESKLRQPQNFSGYGLVVTTPSLIHSMPIYESSPQTQFPTEPRVVQQPNFRSSIQSPRVSLREENKSSQQVEEVKNVKQPPQVKPVVKPVINGFQSTVKPPPTHKPYSMPQNLLK